MRKVANCVLQQAVAVASVVVVLLLWTLNCYLQQAVANCGRGPTQTFISYLYKCLHLGPRRKWTVLDQKGFNDYASNQGAHQLHS